MDTFRSEVSYSSDAMGSSRFGSSSASLSFSLSSSRTSTRSDMVSSFEQKFLERRANAKKKHEREKKRLENNQRTESAEDKRRVEREKAREIRRREMENWLPTPSALQQVERASRQRSRARMREVRDWYPLPSSDDAAKGVEHDEMLPVFGDQPPRCRAGTRQRAEEVAERERQALETGMKKRLAALKDRVSYLESAAAVVVRDELSSVPARAGRLEPLERPFPLTDGAARGLEQSKETRSMSALLDRRQLDSNETLRMSQSLVLRAHTTTASSSSVSKRPRRRNLVYQNANTHASVNSTDELLEREAEERDEAETRLFLAAHRRIARRNQAATTLQAAWRGLLRRRAFLRWSHRRWAYRRDIFSVWVMMHRVGKMAQRALLRSCLCRWRREVALLARLRELEFELFVDAEKQPASASLPKLVVNLALASDEWASDDEDSNDGESDDNEDDSDQGESAPPTASTDVLVLGGLVNAAFAGVQQAAALDSAGRARLRRVRHAEVRANVRRKIAQRVFLTWKRAHTSRRRVALNAQLCLKRAARLFMASTTSASTSKGVWPREKLLTVFDMWARYAAFSRCRRTGVPLPVFAQPSAQWDVWLHNFQERQVRKVKVSARASVARQRRFLMRIRAFARRQRRKRERLELVVHHASVTLRRRVLVEWRAAIADQAANKKCCRRALEALSSYAALKRRLRPLKQLVAENATRYGKSRAWRAWGGVHLRAVCKRAWNVARITHFPEWRRRATRTLLVWRWKPRHNIECSSGGVDSAERQQLKESGEAGDAVDGHAASDPSDVRELSFDDRCDRQMRLWRILTAWRHSTHKRGLFRSLRFHCARLRRKRLLFAVLNAWKQQVWKLADDDSDDSDGDSVMKHVAFLEDRLAVDPWDAYRELSPMLPTLFFGYYSDAAAIFGGVASIDSNNNVLTRAVGKATDALTQRVYSAVEVQQFHRVISGESLAEVRNAVLRSKHLVNAVDPTTGDSALHVALQGEDHARRLEVLVLLLTEGAATHDRPNRHGLTPRQLAVSDPNAQKLLDNGVYTFFEAAAACQTRQIDSDADQADNVVLWRVVALMLGELGRNVRIKADVRHDVWHSQLREELWLRQDRLRFPTSSRFLPSVLRCRAYLDGMRKRICRPLKRALGVEQGSPPAIPGIDEQYGELAPYARFLLAPLLEHEAAETGLIHSFVGVLFSLDFPLQEAMDEAFRLEDACSALETELSATWDQLQSSERQLATTLTTSCAQLINIKHVIPLLRYFKDQSGMDYAMKRELLMSTHESRQQRTSQAQEQDSANELQHRETLPGLSAADELKDAEGLKASAQRKVRKLVKKLKTLEDQIPVLESGFRESLVVDGRSVSGICAARTKLERARLAKTSLLIKKADLQLLLSRLDATIAPIKSAQTLSLPSKTPSLGEAGAVLAGTVTQAGNSNASVTVVPFSEVKHHVEEEIAALSRIFDAVAAGSTASDDGDGNSDPIPSADTPSSASSVSADSGPKELAVTLLASIPSLQRRLEALLRDLFITNLFRTCCCWLAENMVLASVNAESAQQEEEELQDSSTVSSSGATLSTAVSSAAPTTANKLQDVMMQRATRRRRTSLTNTRRVLETFQRDGTSIDMMDRDVDRMKDTYADSASLLFKAERAAIAGAAIEQRRTRERVQATQIISNPITGEPEEAPTHTVDPSIPIETPAVQSAEEMVAMHCNRKKEELRHAMMLRQLDRMAVKVRRRSSVAPTYRGEADADEADDNVDESSVLILPAVHGDALPLGNFILRSLSDDATISDSIDLTSWTGDGEYAPSSARYVTEPSMIEAMWKRGARGDTKNVKPVSGNESQGSLPVDKGVSSTNGSTPQSSAPNPAKRVHSASQRTAESDPMTQRIRNRSASVHGIGAFSTAEKVDGTSLAQHCVGVIAHGESERDVSRARRVVDDKIGPHKDGGTVARAVVEDLSEVEGAADTHAADEDASASALSAGEDRHCELDDTSGCHDAPAIPEEDTGDGQDGHQAIGHASVVDIVGTAAENVPANVGDSSTLLEQDWHDGESMFNHIGGQIKLPIEAADASAEELDALLVKIRSRPLSADLVNPSTTSTPPVQASPLPAPNYNSADVSDASRPHQGTDAPLIFWEMQPGAPEIHREHPMVVQRLPLPDSTSTRHVIEYSHPSESAASPLTKGRVAQRTLGSSVLKVANAVKWEEGNDDEGLLLSLHGKSLRMEGRRSRAELPPQHRQRTVSDAGMTSTVTNVQAVHVRENRVPTDAADHRDSSEGGVAVPAITISVVAKSVASAADKEDKSAEEGVLPCTEDASTKETAVKRGPFFVMDADGSTPAADLPSVMEITGVNSRAVVLGSSLSEASLAGRSKQANPIRSTTTAKSTHLTSKAKGAVNNKEELNRARAKCLGPQTSASCGDLLLEGANILADSKTNEQLVKQEGIPLTKLQKESVWKEFAVAPLSEAMQNAYAELYPQTYSRAATAMASARSETTEPAPPTDQVTTTPIPASMPLPLARLSMSSSAAQLTVLPASISRKKSSPKTVFELDKKFWRAIEGYRAIGSSPMIPLDEATVKRRRRDKAESIYASFIADDAGRDPSVPGQQQLEWVAMYPDQVAAIRRRLKTAPIDLFDSLQQTAQLRITTALSSTGAALE